MFRKGTTLLRKTIEVPSEETQKPRQVIFPIHSDLIKEKFWKDHDEILTGKKVKLFDWTQHFKDLPQFVLKQL